MTARFRYNFYRFVEFLRLQGSDTEMENDTDPADAVCVKYFEVGKIFRLNKLYFFPAKRGYLPYDYLDLERDYPS